MKKILILGLLAFYSHVSTAQSAEEIVSPNNDTTAPATKPTSLEERLNKQEIEIQALKKDNAILKDQIKQMKPSFLNAKRKTSVSRVGSKQVVVE
jgi:hypothetical protein